METKINRSLLKMAVLTCTFVAALLITFVYSVDVDSLITKSVGYINSYGNGSNEDVGNSTWTYVCNADSKCTKKKATEDENTTNLETCTMTCDHILLWPKPTSVQLSRLNSSRFDVNQITVQIHATDDIKEDVNEAMNIFISNLPQSESMVNDTDISSFEIDTKVSGEEKKLKIYTNESYSLSITKNDRNILISISAPTYFGVRHALETLSQLIWLDSESNNLRIAHDVQVDDSPKFSHRGLMVDTARNYFPVEQLKNVIDGMAASKLNVFHLHLTDSVSFPIVLPNNPTFAKYGSYSPEMVYTPEAIKDLIEYSRIRGIRVILEIDAPSHANEGWNKKAENLVICGEDDVFNGHLNPENKETLEILESVYRDLLDLGTDNEMFHIGGDEVNLTCWMEIVPGSHYRKDMHLYWANFTNEIFDTVKSANGNELPKHIVLWSSPLTDSYIRNLNYKDNVVIQYWYGSVSDILASGHKVIFSTVGRWYLDCGFGPWRPSQTNGVCDPYTHWKTFYQYRPWKEFSSYADQFLGGEACLWSEQVSVDSLETRIWPRAAAFAERLWSDPDSFNSYDVFTRLDFHNQRLRNRGIKTAAIWPRWCSKNPGKC